MIASGKLPKDRETFHGGKKNKNNNRTGILNRDLNWEPLRT
jgi:hypothetical protein